MPAGFAVRCQRRGPPYTYGLILLACDGGCRKWLSPRILGQRILTLQRQTCRQLTGRRSGLGRPFSAADDRGCLRKELIGLYHPIAHETSYVNIPFKKPLDLPDLEWLMIVEDVKGCPRGQAITFIYGIRYQGVLNSKNSTNDYNQPIRFSHPHHSAQSHTLSYLREQ